MTNRRRSTNRVIGFERLESRQMMTASPFDPATPPLVNSPNVFAQAGQISTQIQDVEASMQLVRLRVDGALVTINASSPQVEVRLGQTISIDEIGFNAPQGAGSLGVLAMEGYISNAAGDLDYGNGRFSAGTAAAAAANDPTRFQLAGDWTVTASMQRIVLLAVRYTETGSTITDRLVLKLQVGSPDLRITAPAPNESVVVGKPFHARTSWSAEGASASESFNTYAELDIYRISDLDTPVWVGIAIGAVAGGGVHQDVFVNSNPNDPFSFQWTPDQAGEYLLVYTIDPEHTVAESNETNNRFTQRVTVLSYAETVAQVAINYFDVAINGQPRNVMSNNATLTVTPGQTITPSFLSLKTLPVNCPTTGEFQVEAYLGSRDDAGNVIVDFANGSLSQVFRWSDWTRASTTLNMSSNFTLTNRSASLVFLLRNNLAGQSQVIEQWTVQLEMPV